MRVLPLADVTRDKSGNPIDLYEYFGAVSMATSASSARKALPVDADIVCLYATGNGCYIQFGDGLVTVASTDGNFALFLDVGYYFLHPVYANVTYIAAKTVSSTGTLIISGVR